MVEYTNFYSGVEKQIMEMKSLTTTTLPGSASSNGNIENNHFGQRSMMEGKCQCILEDEPSLYTVISQIDTC